MSSWLELDTATWHILYQHFKGQLILLFKDHFPASVFHEITGIIDVLKKNKRDKNEQTAYLKWQSLLNLRSVSQILAGE